MSGKAYLTKKKRDTQGLTVNQIPAGCRLIVPSLNTGDKDYKQSFTFNENPAAYLIPLTKPAADIDTIYDDLSTLQRPRIRDKSGRYPDTLLLSALFSILQNDQDQTGDTATIDIRDFLVFTGKLRSNTAPAHYAELEAKLDPLLYLGGIIGGNFYPVLSEYQINEDQRLFTFKSPYCKALINQIKQDQSAAGNRAAYCRAIQASICTARNKAAAAAVCYAACIILQSGKEKKTTAKEKKTKTKTVTFPEIYGGKPHINAVTLIENQAEIKQRYEGKQDSREKGKYLRKVFDTCSKYFDEYTDLKNYTFPELHITKATLNNQEIKFYK